MRLLHASLLLLVATGAVIVALASGSTLDDLLVNKRSGKVVWGEFYDIPKVGGARAWVYSELAKDGKPLASGIKLTRKFVESAKSIPCMYNYKGVKGMEALAKSCESTMMMDFPKGSPFKLMVLNYATEGHPPIGVYSLPHFDIHFYIESKKWLVDNLGPKAMGKCNGFSPRAWYLVNRPIPAQCFPKGYANFGAAVPMMGNHMFNPAAHEFTQPGSFNATFLYGTFAGKVAYYEPMITRMTFLDKKAFCGPIPSQPEEHQDAGWYPSTWCYYSYNSSGKKSDHGDTYIELRDYTWHKAGCKRPAKAYDGYLLSDPKTVPAGCAYVKPPPKPAGKPSGK